MTSGMGDFSAINLGVLLWMDRRDDANACGFVVGTTPDATVYTLRQNVFRLELWTFV